MQQSKNFGAGYWPRIRAGDSIETIYWLYNRTGESWLLDLAKRIHENMQDWTTGVHDWHNVNLAQGFRNRASIISRTVTGNFSTPQGATTTP